MALSTSRTLVTKTGISTTQVFDMGGINISGGDFNLGSAIKLGNASGIITCTTFSGSGASLTNLPSGNLTGTVADARISTLTASKLSGALPAISAANLTNIPAANITGTLPAISGANLTNLDASDLASGTVPTARLGSGTANNTTFLRGDSTFQTVNTDLVSDTSPQLGGSLDTNSKNIVFGDSSGTTVNRLTFGDGDLHIYHNGSDSVIREQGTGNLDIQTTGGNVDILVNTTEHAAKFISNGAVELYHDNSLKFETTSSGTRTTGAIHINDGAADSNRISVGNGGDLKIFHTNPNTFIQNSSAALVISAARLDINNAADNEQMARFTQDGAVELYHNNIKKFDTITTGIRVHGDEGGTAQLQLLADEGDDNPDYWRFIAETNGILNIQDYGSGNWYNNIRLTGNTGGVELYHNNAKKLETWAGGIKLNGVENAGSQLMIGANGDLALEHDGSNTYIANNTGDLVLQNDANVKITAKAGGTQRFRFDTDGLKFGTDTAAANALDDYEEGSFNVTLVGQYGGNAQYSYRAGYYTRIGRIVHVVGDVRFNGSWSGSSGNVYIQLPLGASFASGGTVGNGSVSEWNLNASTYDYLGIQIDNNAANAKITTHDGNNNNTGYLQTGLLANNRSFKFGFTYITA